MNLKSLNIQIRNHSLILNALDFQIRHFESLQSKSNLTKLELKQLKTLLKNTLKNYKLLNQQYFQIINNNPKIKYRQHRKQQKHLKQLFPELY